MCHCLLEQRERFLQRALLEECGAEVDACAAIARPQLERATEVQRRSVKRAGGGVQRSERVLKRSIIRRARGERIELA